MKFQLDPKFLITSSITFSILIVTIVILNTLLGTAAATVAGTVLGGISLKLFDRLDYTPTITFTTPLYPKGLIISLVVSVFMLIGPLQLIDAVISYFKLAYGDNYICNPVFLISLFVLDWGAFIVAGLLIGKLYPERALLFTFIAAVIGILVVFPRLYSVEAGERLKQLIDCYISEDPNRKINEVTKGLKSGAFVGLILRTYIAIFFARLSSRKAKGIVTQKVINKS